MTQLLILLNPDSYVYIGWGIMALLTLLAVLLCLKFRRKWLWAAFAVPLLLLWYVFLYGVYVGFYQFEVRRVEIAFDDLPAAFDGYRIVQLSDVHVGTLTGHRQDILKRAVDSINAQKADMVVFTGDMLNKVPDEVEAVKHLLSAIKARDGVFSVLGNHDYPMYVEADDFEKYEFMGRRSSIDHDLGWTLLCNDHRIIRRDSDRLVISGMENDGEGRFPQLGDVQVALSGLTRREFVVMLEHDPTAWRRKILPQTHTQLTLSGHTHGGQLALGDWSLAGLTYKEPCGLYEINNRYLYVSKGLSGVVPFRFGTPGEIVVITLRKK